MTCLYNPEDIEKLKRKYKIRSAVSIAIAVLAVIALVVMCIKTGTLNAEAMENGATVMIMVAGWIEIYLLINGLIGLKREIKHAEMLNSEETEALEGEINVTKQFVRITGSVVIRKVEVKTEDGTKRVNVVANRAKMLENLSGPVKLYTTHGYISGFEVEK